MIVYSFGGIMNKHRIEVRIIALAVLVAACEMCGVVKCPTVFGQEKQESSRREAEAIKNIEAAGGRVMQISSADSTREVSFYLAGKKVEDKHLSDLGAVKDVIWLNLANTGITNDGLKQLSGMKLQKLHLEKTAIGDEGLVHLKEMTDLEYLNLYGTSVTDEGLKHLAKLNNLKRLYVWQSKVTKEGMENFEKQIPGLKVIGESKLPVSPPPKKKENAEKDGKEPKAENLKAREEALQKKEKELKEREAKLKEREESLKKKEKELGKGSDKG